MTSPCPAEPPYRFLVLSPILHPVPAKAGDVLVVRPGHATRPIAVVRHENSEWIFVRSGPPNYGALLCREDDGVIIELSSASLAAHPLVQSA